MSMTREARLVVRFYSQKIIQENHSIRKASLSDLDDRVLSVFGEQIYKSAGIKGLGSKLKALYTAFMKTPKLWNALKEKLEITSKNPLTLYRELSDKLDAYLEEGKKWINSKVKKIRSSSKMVEFMFIYAENAPTLSDLISKILDPANKLIPYKESEKMRAFKNKILGGVRSFKEWLKAFFKRHPILRVMSTPVKAYLYWLIWTHVAEISWKVSDLIKGFLGILSWEDLLDSLPESGLGFLVGVLFPFIPQGSILKSLNIGWNALLIPAMGIQLYYLYDKGYLDNNLNLKKR